jgi:hypothetical protein
LKSSIRDYQTDSVALHTTNNNASRANQRSEFQSKKQQIGSQKLSGSIIKPSAANPFNISLSDEKLTGESINSLPTSRIPPGTPLSSTDMNAVHWSRSTRHLPQVESLLPPPQPCPVRISDSPPWLPTIQEIVSTPSHVLGESPFIFNLTPEAATHNMIVLLAHESNIQMVIDNHQHTLLTHGSEFRSISVLQRLLMHHPKWPKIQSLLKTGSLWPLTHISDSDRQAKNTELISRGNHKSAIAHAKILTDTLIKEVNQGWMVPIPTSFINQIRNAEVAPVGIAQQWQALEDGSRTFKYRLTHDQSFEASIGESVNVRVKKDKLDHL